MTIEGAGLTPLRPEAAPPPADAPGAASQPVGQLDGEQVVLVQSGSSPDNSYSQQIGQLNRNMLSEPVTHSNEKTGPVGSERLNSLVNKLDANNNSIFGKIRSLAKSFLKLFAGSKGAAGPAAATAPTPYDAALRRIDPDNKQLPGKVHVNLTLLSEFHAASRKIPEVSQQLANAGKGDDLAANLGQPGGALNRLIGSADALQHLHSDAIGKILDADPDFKSRPGADDHAVGIKKAKLRLNVESAAGRIAAVLNESYTPRNPQLRELVKNLPEGATRLSQFAKPENNPYEKLSASEHFSEADDAHLRAWMSQALKMIDNDARFIDAAMLENKTNTDAVLYKIDDLRRLNGGDQ